MRTPIRILAALVAAFQVPVGVACVLAPALAAGSFGIATEGAPAVAALVRMFGGLLAGTGLFAGAFVVDPDRPAPWGRLLAAALGVSVATDGLVLVSGELGLAQVGVGMGLEALLALALLVARPPRP